MWRYLILNTLWLSILFLVHFHGNRRSRDFVRICVYVAAFFLLTWSFVDPLAWFFYLLASVVAFRCAGRMRDWAFARSTALEQDLFVLNQRSDKTNAVLADRTTETDAIGKKADDISYLCEKIKEMSQTLDQAEAFLVFGEALSKNFWFESIKLVLLGQGFSQEDQSPERVYELSYTDFQGFFDRDLLLKEKKRSSVGLRGLDGKILKAVLEERKPVYFESDGKAIVWPIWMESEIAAVFILYGFPPKDTPIVSVLSESFASEIQRIQLFERVQMLAVTDGLTGVSARRHLLERFQKELERSKRLGLKLSFLMIDIDDFKHFNDHYGHLVGDVVLKEVAETVRKNIREVDLVGRYGGEEFGVFLTETDETGALFVAERIRKTVAEKVFRAYGEDLKVTISIGCSTYSKPLNTAILLIEAADTALYDAKREGKNRVQLANMEVQS